MNYDLINALVAERVMGWTYLNNDETSAQLAGVARPIYCSWIDKNKKLRTIGDFDPSRNIAHAMEVFDKFEDGVITKDAWGYEVKTNLWISEHDANLCIAICLAALRAVGVTDKEIEKARIV